MYALCHIQWDNTGLYHNDVAKNEHNAQVSEQVDTTLILGLSFGYFRPSNVVLYHLWERECCIQHWDEFDKLYQTILTEGNPANAKHLAKEQYAQKILHERTSKGSPLSSLDAVKEALDSILQRGERWRALVQAVQSAEVLLMYQNRGTFDQYSIIGNVIDYGSDEAFDNIKRRVLAPECRLQQTCLQLTGLRDMITELANAPVRSEFRKYLVTTVQSRIDLVFGPVETKWLDVLTFRRLLSLVDRLTKNIADILGFCIEVKWDWSQVKDAPADSQGHKLYQMHKQLVGEEEEEEDEHTEGNNNTNSLDLDQEAMHPDSGPTPPSAYANLSPSNWELYDWD